MRTDILLREKQIKNWIKENKSKSYICRELNCKPQTLNFYLEKLGISYSGDKPGRYRDRRRKHVNEYLFNGSTINTHKLKLFLIRDGLKERKCEICNLESWLNEDIPIELHHKNGVQHDNRIENLQIVCPNCHALTDNHAGKGKKIASLPQSAEGIDLKSTK